MFENSLDKAWDEASSDDHDNHEVEMDEDDGEYYLTEEQKAEVRMQNLACTGPATALA